MEFIIAPEGMKLRDIDIWGDLYEAMERGVPVEAVITGVRHVVGEEDCWELAFDNKPGITGFCTANESGLPVRAPINDFVGQIIFCKISRIDKKNSAIICSRKEIVETNSRRLLSQLEQDNEINAVVRAVNRNVYVDIGGGVIINIRQEKARLSDGVPLSVQYKEGDIIKVIVTRINKDERILEVEPVDPWGKQNYNRGEVVSGQVVQIRDNLAFVKVKPGIIGRVYYNKADSYSEGEYIKLQVSDFNPETRRLHLIRYDSRRITDRRRERVKRAKKRSQSSPGNEVVKTLGGFDYVQKLAAGNTNELIENNEEKNEQCMVVNENA